MLRGLWLLVLLGALASAAAWLADDPGDVTLHWRGWRLDTSFSLLLGAVVLIAVAAALLYRLWIALGRVPGRLTKARDERRRRRGYLALTRGMVAVAAGDADEARRQTRRADVLLGDPPLTMLLSAQAARLDGDKRAAGNFFTAMLGRPETEFLGVRGLLIQAMNDSDEDKALDLAHRAYSLRPKSEWVASNLFDLQVRAGRWVEAGETLSRSVRHKLVSGDAGRRGRAVIRYCLGLEARARGDGAEYLKALLKAHDLDPEFIPAAVSLARRLAADAKKRKAASLIERAWRRQPHPGFVEAYGEASGAKDALEQVAAAQRLAELNPGHVESRLAVAAAALDAELWDEARKNLEAAAGDGASVRVCRLMARLEEREGGDASAAREWLMRASMADPEPTWVCDSCGNWVAEWTALCGKCSEFDSFVWRAPPHVLGLAGEGESIRLASPDALPPES